HWPADAARRLRARKKTPGEAPEAGGFVLQNDELSANKKSPGGCRGSAKQRLLRVLELDAERHEEGARELEIALRADERRCGTRLPEIRALAVVHTLDRRRGERIEVLEAVRTVGGRDGGVAVDLRLAVERVAKLGLDVHLDASDRRSVVVEGQVGGRHVVPRQIAALAEVVVARRRRVRVTRVRDARALLRIGGRTATRIDRADHRVRRAGVEALQEAEVERADRRRLVVRDPRPNLMTLVL